MKKHVNMITWMAVIASASLTARAATDEFNVTASSSLNYTINGESDPTLTLVRGFSYTFNINASSHPFWIKMAQGTGTGNAYNDGVTNNGENVGVITFDVPNDAPDTLYYNCQFHSGMTAPINIIDPPVIVITDGNVGTNVTLVSTGTDALNLNVLVNTDLTNNVWTDATIQDNIYADGTNTTQVALPAGDAAFFQVQQGFFTP